jgi:hypothetical protein
MAGCARDRTHAGGAAMKILLDDADLDAEFGSRYRIACRR